MRGTRAYQRDVGVLLDEVSDVGHLLLEIRCPYFPYSRHVESRWNRRFYTQSNKPT